MNTWCNKEQKAVNCFVYYPVYYSELYPTYTIINQRDDRADVRYCRNAF